MDAILNLDRARKKAEEIQQRLDRATSEIRAMATTEAQILNQLDDTERLLNRIRREINATEIELSEIRTKISTRRFALRKLKEKILDRETYTAKRLTALYKLNCVGNLPFLAAADSSIDFIRRKNGLEFILANDQQELEQLQQEKKIHSRMIAQLNQQQSEKNSIESQLHQRKETLSIQLNKRVRLLSQIQRRKNLQSAAVEELKKSAGKLEETIASLSKTTSDPVPQSQRTEKDFSRFKGLLNLPVKGRILYFYGRYTNKEFNVVNFRTGITIQADRGEPIRSVGKGITIFADWFRGYGNMIIIDHGNHYYTVYAYLEEIFKTKGDRVEADEVIATMGDAGSMGGAGLHFEVRHHGKPLDPMEWIRKG